MAPGSHSASTPAPELSEEVPSPADLPSARPKPFDDSEIPSPKRRRTSLSVSPVASVDTANTVHDTSSSAPLQADRARLGHAMDLDLNDSLASPRTPKRPPVSPTTPRSGSRVTINLRRRDAPDAPAMSPLTPPDVGPTSPPGTSRRAPSEHATPPGSSPPSLSPPLEPIAIAEAGDAGQANGQRDLLMESSVTGTFVDMIADSLLLAEPHRTISFSGPDALRETLQGLMEHISSGPSAVDGNVLGQLARWLDRYVRYNLGLDAAATLEMCLSEGSFWHALSKVLLCLSTKGWELLRHPGLHLRVLEVYNGFAKLTARFVVSDTLAIKKAQAAEEPSEPQLFAAAYIQHLHNIFQPQGFDTQPVAPHPATNPPWILDHLELYIVRSLQGGLDDDVDKVLAFASALADIVPQWPKLADNFAPLGCLLTDFMRETLHVLHDEQDDTVQATRTLDTCYRMMGVISASWMTAVDKHAASINNECAISVIQTLSDAWKLWLQSDAKEAQERLREHRRQHPALAPNFTLDAVAWEWKIEALAKVIRTSQMHLRMTAVTTMCAFLVGMWKRLSEGGEEDNLDFLGHLATHLLQTGLVDYIIGGCCHPEITPECANIVGFLVVTKTYRSEHFDRAWKVMSTSQDHRVVDALTRMISAILGLFDYDQMLHVCEKLQLLPLERFSPSMRLVLDNLLNEMMAKSQANHSTLTFHPYELCLRLLRDSSVFVSDSQIADPDTQHLVMQKFKDLLGCGPDTEGRTRLYLSCVDDIASKSATTLGSLWCLYMTIRNSATSQMQLLTENHDLARLLVDEFETAVSAGREAGGRPVLSGTMNLARREFVTYLVHLQPDAIGSSLIARLWGLMVGPASSCLDDRRAAWHILLSLVRKTSFHNTFLEACFADLLPQLPATYFCDGMLEFIKEKIQPPAKDSGGDLVLDDEDAVTRSGIGQLWRLILGADDQTLVGQAVSLLAVGVYLESDAIANYPSQRTRRVHLALVARCLHHMRDAASKLKQSEDCASSGSADKAGLERIFTRSLQLLRFFLEKYQSKPNFAVADLRSFMSKGPVAVEGDSAHLKYQSFDGAEQTDILPLRIGKLNTISALLASLREATGFDNFRAYFCGRQLLPSERDICKSLDDLGIKDGFIIVKREDNYSLPPARIKAGSLPLEIEVLAHFPELWDYLSMGHGIAEEIYDFVINLPSDGHILSQFDSEATSYKELFLPGQPYKSLYALHALTEYLETSRQAASTGIPGADANRGDTANAHEEAIRRALRLVVQALSDTEVLEGTTTQLKVRLASALMQTFAKLVQGVYGLRDSITVPDFVDAPEPKRLVELLSDAVGCQGAASLPLITGTCGVILRLGRMKSRFWTYMTESPTFRDLVRQLLLFDQRRSVRIAALELFESSVDTEAPPLEEDEGGGTSTERPKSEGLAQYLWPITLELELSVLELPDQCHQIFNLLKRLIIHLRGQADLAELAVQTSTLLLQHEPDEHIADKEPNDPIISGLSSVLYLCLATDEALAGCDKLPTNFVKRLLLRHLFPKRAEPGLLAVSPVVLNTDTRTMLYEIIFRLVRHDRVQVAQILKLLNDLVPFYLDDTEEPYLYDLPQQFDRLQAVRPPCGYVGLRNLSNTCYLNSLLTQLYMNPEFRRFILGVNISDPSESQHLLFRTQQVFGHMQDSYRRFVDPAAFVSSIKTYDDTCIDIYNQMDVDEFYNLLFDRWEGQLRHPDDRKKLRAFYGGQLVQQVKSKECNHISEVLEPFSAIQCDIKGKNTLEESLQAYVDGEIMEGDNKYKCSHCDKHVDAVKRACLKDVPDNVIFHLKRFDFNLRTLQRSKIHDHFSFPQKIDLRPYTIEHLSDSGTDAAEDVFELVGVLVHTGTAESGHYYSYVRERPWSTGEHNWIEFNDDMVTPWEFSQLAHATFGGPDHQASYEANGVIYDKPYSAYMLFYQRASSLRAQQDEMAAQGISAPLRVGMPRPLQGHIATENTVCLRRHCLFDPSHIVFVQKCFGRARRLEQEGAGPHDLQNMAMDMALSHLDQVVCRTKEVPHFASFSAMLGEAIASCPECALRFVGYFALRPMALRTLLQRSPEPHVRGFVGDSLIRAAKKVAAELPDLYDGQASEELGGGSGQSVTEDVVGMFNHMWLYFQFHLRSWDEYFGTMLQFAELGQREATMLLSENFLAKTLMIIAADPDSQLSPNYARMLNTVLRRGSARPPSYSAIITLIAHLLTLVQASPTLDMLVDKASHRAAHEAPAPWTAEEMQIVNMEPSAAGAARRPGSLFVEKLLAIDQAPGATRQIMGRLCKLGALTETTETMDRKIFRSLRHSTEVDSSSQPIDAFLRGAGYYIEGTPHGRHGHLLAQHISDQAPKLQSSEGLAFLDFMRVALRSQLPDEEAARARRGACLELMASWAPSLLVYRDMSTRHDAEKLIGEELFGSASARPSGDEGAAAGDGECMGRLIRRVGTACLVYLRDVHVRGHTRIEREAAWSVLRMVARCAPFFEAVEGGKLDDEFDYSTMQDEVIEPLHHLMTEELDDDASDWEGSCASSDPMEVTVGMSLGVVDQLNGHEAA